MGVPYCPYPDPCWHHQFGTTLELSVQRSTNCANKKGSLEAASLFEILTFYSDTSIQPEYHFSFRDEIEEKNIHHHRVSGVHLSSDHTLLTT